MTGQKLKQFTYCTSDIVYLYRRFVIVLNRCGYSEFMKSNNMPAGEML